MHCLKTRAKAFSHWVANSTPGLRTWIGIPNGLRTRKNWEDIEERERIPGLLKYTVLPVREVQVREAPVPVDTESPAMWPWTQRWQPRQRWAALLDRWRVWAPGWSISPDRKIDLHLCPHWNTDLSGLIHQIRPPFSLPRSLEGRTLNLCTDTHLNYFHWTLDLLPKILVAADCGYELSQFDHVLVNSRKLEFQTESLKRMGVRGEQIVSLCDFPHLVLEESVVPSWPDQSGLFSESYLTRLRDLLAPDSNFPSVTTPRRIFVTRHSKFGRGIANWLEVKESIERFGFESVPLEGLSLQEQQDLFQNSEAVIAVHGAALTNLMYCKSDTRVLEILSPDFAAQMYFYLASTLGLNYRYIVAELAEDKQPQYSNLRVDCDKLRSYLRGNF